MTTTPNIEPFSEWLLVRVGNFIKKLNFKLRYGSNSVGRSEYSTDVCVISKFTSRKHCSIFVDKTTGKVRIDDLGGSNGTFVNNKRLPVNKKDHELVSGDLIGLGAIQTEACMNDEEIHVYRLVKDTVIELSDSDNDSDKTENFEPPPQTNGQQQEQPQENPNDNDKESDDEIDKLLHDLRYAATIPELDRSCDDNLFDPSDEPEERERVYMWAQLSQRNSEVETRNLRRRADWISDNLPDPIILSDDEHEGEQESEMPDSDHESEAEESLEDQQDNNKLQEESEVDQHDSISYQEVSEVDHQPRETPEDEQYEWESEQFIVETEDDDARIPVPTLTEEEIKQLPPRSTNKRSEWMPPSKKQKIEETRKIQRRLSTLVDSDSETDNEFSKSRKTLKRKETSNGTSSSNHKEVRNHIEPSLAPQKPSTLSNYKIPKTKTVSNQNEPSINRADPVPSTSGIANVRKPAAPGERKAQLIEPIPKFKRQLSALKGTKVTPVKKAVERSPQIANLKIDRRQKLQELAKKQSGQKQQVTNDSNKKQTSIISTKITQSNRMAKMLDDFNITPGPSRAQAIRNRRNSVATANPAREHQRNSPGVTPVARISSPRKTAEDRRHSDENYIQPQKLTFAAVEKVSTVINVKVTKTLVPCIGKTKERDQSKPKKKSVTFDLEKNKIHLIEPRDEVVEPVGTKSIWDQIQTEVVCWNPEELDTCKNFKFPTIRGCQEQDLQTVKNVYANIEDYKNTLIPMLKLELWSKIYSMYEERKEKEKKDGKDRFLNLKVLKMEPYPHRLILKTTYERNPELKSGNLIIVWYNNFDLQDGTNKCCFGYILHLECNRHTNEWIIQIQISPQEILVRNSSKLAIIKVANIGYIRNEMKSLVGIETLRFNSKILQKVLNPASIEPLKESTIEYNDDKFWDFDQRLVINKVTYDCLNNLSVPNIIAIEAGPGTGKTVSIVNMILTIHKFGLEKFGRPLKFLVCSISNTCINEITEKLLIAQSTGRTYIYNLLRTGNSEKINTSIQDVFLSSKINRELRRDHAKSYDSLRREFIQEADIICTTVNSSYDLIDPQKLYDICIIDEATQCKDSDLILPLQLNIRKVVLVGDSRQLPSMVSSQLLRNRKMDTSLFKRILLTASGPDVVLRLRYQYRMHPDIVDFPNRRFYAGELKSCVNTSGQILTPYCLFNLDSDQNLTQNIQCNIYNMTDLDFVIRLLKQIIQVQSINNVNNYSFGIITPYARQRNECIEKLNRHRLNKQLDVTVYTIDSAQGLEKDVIIITTARTKGVGFLDNPQRLNVALTRAKRSLYICGNFSCLKQRSELWRQLIFDAIKRKLFYEMDQIATNEDLMKRISYIPPPQN